MGYKWLPVTEDFDKTLVIKKWRYDVNNAISGNYDGALSELPNIDIKTCWTNPLPENGYAFSNRFNLGTDYFSSRYYGFTDGYWTATTGSHTTLVEGTIYEFECPVDLYWAGVRESTWNPNIPNMMWFYVQSSTFEIAPTETAATYESGTTTITVNTDNDSSITWTASTNDSWLSLSTLTGAGDGSVTVTYTENPTFQNRTGTVTFTSNAGDIFTFTIEQEMKPALVYDRPIYRSGNLVKKMYRSGELIYYKLNYSQPTPPGPEETPLTFIILSSGTINWKAQNTAYTTSIDYKLNEGEWTTITSNTGDSAPRITVSTGDVLQFKGSNAAYSSGSSYYNSFTDSTAKFEVEGNIMSLIDSTNYATATTLVSSQTFYRLFYHCTGLTSSENLILPATTLAQACYTAMFSGCTSLTTAPELPATTLPNACYQNMFEDCTSLTTAPELPATTLADWCYCYMFSGCTSLTTAPELPATTLAYRCYQYMFRGCTSLTTAPELPATTLADRCYYGMFRDCASLNYIKCLATDISATFCTSDWVKGVSSTGTFVKPSSMSSWTSGINGIPSGWTVQNT